MRGRKGGRKRREMKNIPRNKCLATALIVNNVSDRKELDHVKCDQ